MFVQFAVSLLLACLLAPELLAPEYLAGCLEWQRWSRDSLSLILSIS